MQQLELLQRLCLSVCLDKLVSEHQPNVVLPRAKIGKLLESPKRLVQLAAPLHSVSVLEKVLLRVAVEPLLRADQTELVIDAASIRRIAKDLVAKSNRVVEEAALGVKINCL